MAYEQRRHPRLPESIRLSVEIPGWSEDSSECSALDVSEGGASLDMKKAPPDGTEIVAHIVLSSSVQGDAYLRVEGRVIWSRPADTGEGYLVGIEFSYLPEADRVLLREHISRRRPMG